MVLSVELIAVFRGRWGFYLGSSWCTIRVILDFVFHTLEVANKTPASPEIYAYLSFAASIVVEIGTLHLLIFLARVRTFDSVCTRSWLYLAYTAALICGARGRPFGPAYHLSWPELQRALSSAQRGPQFLAWILQRLLQPPEVLSTLAFLSYWVAALVGHEHAFSRTLGGPGVERLTFWQFGQGPRVDSMSRDEGRIRLP